MKKIKLIILLTLTAICLKAQPYKPMAEFGADTLNYLKYNFETRKSQYIGYTVEKIINDYELEMKDVTSRGPYVFADNKFYLKGISISHVNSIETRRKWNTKSAMIEFDIDFEPPYEDEWAFWHYAPHFNTERERALYVKDKIVKDIKVYVFQPKTSTLPAPPSPDPGGGGKKPREIRPIDDDIISE
ncbi:MAG: hypothetical protein LBS69_03250 [Prevotellaceae bacterium]|nr:hypothetical protein [Prevotellaceae bacterium]